MSSSLVTEAPPSVRPSLRSFWGRHKVIRRSRPPKPLWTISQRAPALPGHTPTWTCSRSFKAWGARGRRECKMWRILKDWRSCHGDSVTSFNVFYRTHQRSNEHRELSLLGYLSQLQSPDPGPVRPLHTLTPYQVNCNYLSCYYPSIHPSSFAYLGLGQEGKRSRHPSLQQNPPSYSVGSQGISRPDWII